MLWKITEKSFKSDTGDWAISLVACGELHDLVLKDPLSAKDQEEFDWFFQQHVKFPLTDTVRAAKVVEAIKDYGQSLYRQTIGAIPFSAAFKQFCALRNEDALDGLCIEIVGSAAFQRLYWETLRDDRKGLDDHPLALQVEINRRPLASPQSISPGKYPLQERPDASAASPAWSLPIRPLNILLVVARPAGVRDAGLRVISRPILDTLNSSTLQGTLQARLDVVRPGSFEGLKAQLERAAARELQYDVVHFDLHGRVSKDRKKYVCPKDVARI